MFYKEHLLLFRKGFTSPVDFFIVLLQGLPNVLVITFHLPFLVVTMLTRINVMPNATVFERQLFTATLTKQLSRFPSKRLLRKFIRGFTVFGLLCEFVLLTLFFPADRFLVIFLSRDMSDGVGTFSILNNEIPEDVDKDCDLQDWCFY